MLPRVSKEIIDNKENSSDESCSPREARFVCHLSQAYLTHHAGNGYVIAQGTSGVTNTVTSQSALALKTGYACMAAAVPQSGYIGVTHSSVPLGYVTSPTSINIPLYVMSDKETHDLNIATERVRVARLRETAEAEHNEKVNKLLLENGFINRVDITKGATASVAVFEYVGTDPALMALTKLGYIIVKLPPYTAASSHIAVVKAAKGIKSPYPHVQYVGVELPHQAPLQLHAELTYRNEFNLITKMNAISSHGYRANVLAVCFEGQRFILNSPIFFDELEFSRKRQMILDRVKRESSSDSSIASSKDEVVADPMIKARAAINALLQQNLINLACYMHDLYSSQVNPIKIITELFTSIKLALDSLHEEGIVHLDIACRNIIAYKLSNEVRAALIDFGVGDSFNKVSGNSKLNLKYPQISMMHNNDALRPGNHLICVMTDYISLQKTFLQALAYYIGADFYSLLINNLHDVPEHLSIDFLSQFSDRKIIDNIKQNLIAFARHAHEHGDERGAWTLELVSQFEPYFNHDHNPNHNFHELRVANSKSFDRCLSQVTVESQHDEASEVNNTDMLHVDQRQAALAAAPRPVMRRSSAAEGIGFFHHVKSDSGSMPVLPSLPSTNGANKH